jgi:hypothetical protein
MSLKMIAASLFVTSRRYAVGEILFNFSVFAAPHCPAAIRGERFAAFGAPAHHIGETGGELRCWA